MSASSKVISLPGFENAIAKKGMMRKDVAEKLGITYPVLWKIVSGEIKRLDPEILKKMAEILECTTDDLLNPPQPSPQRKRTVRSAGAKELA